MRVSLRAQEKETRTFPPSVGTRAVSVAYHEKGVPRCIRMWHNGA